MKRADMPDEIEVSTLLAMGLYLLKEFPCRSFRKRNHP